MTSAPSLSIVIPVYNEPEWIGRSIGALQTALRNADWPAEIVVVDDGSTDDTPKRLAELDGITVISQCNGGRFAARMAGLEAARGEFVLLLDSRVIMEPDSFVYLRDQFAQHPERLVWNGHINTDTTGNPYAGFMTGLVTVGWRKYVANPRLVSFGADEFDSYPKGTGIFLAPRATLLRAATSFESLYDDPKLASDDTRMLRSIADEHRIWLSPGFAAQYNSRDSLQKFVKHAFFRGTTFVDSYLDSPGPVRTAAAGAGVLGVVGLFVLAKFPKTGILLGLGGSAAAGVVVRRMGATRDQSFAVATLLPLFAAVFGAGVVRGLLMAAKKAAGK
ncbi:glycosyltransferase family 2 protein [Lentzea nigeriaca]|uniref:glycosyltransferase family 2 protein n=1 Tax=Lentzea nigeriaca TaxID=1128665 RepID=UPI00195E29E9|nr:glycosyltransferase family 2 protein [Lentzea nigeriaca]MBM7857717.1 glycosyltransferase involved in cell wall biosynthesis/uncharacterized membrane protein YeaQ/YmgE (transglycosylase-associated protein family) [Lentzea nigeriaca]